MEAPAEHTGLPAGHADLVTARNAGIRFDCPQAAAEVARLLRNDGHIVIAHFDWLPLQGNVVEMTEALIRAYNPSWTMGGGFRGMYPAWLRDLGETGSRGSRHALTMRTCPIRQ